jgi:hypothetical protein
MWTAVRDGNIYVRRSRSADGVWATEAFDLQADPGAERDVFDSSQDLHRELEKELEAYKARLVEHHDRHYAQRSLTEEEIAERLRAMGYIQ